VDFLGLRENVFLIDNTVEAVLPLQAEFFFNSQSEMLTVTVLRENNCYTLFI
jgi:hypothetical protein